LSAPVKAEAEVRLHGETVGAVAELEGGRVVFEYTEDFRRRGIELSPVHLPTSLREPVAFDELRNLSAFRGLPGLLADCLPDEWGTRVLRTWLAARGESHRTAQLGPVESLLLIGERGIGALTFHPADPGSVPDASRRPLDITALVEDASRIREGRVEVTDREMLRIAAPAGGRLPKALVLYDVAVGTLRSGFARPEPGDVPCVLKFDGIRTGTPTSPGGPPVHEGGRPLPFNRVEAAYGEMARAAGISTSGITVFETDGYAHLLVRRFDLEGGRRIHQHTLGGLLHGDHNRPGAAAYEDYLRTILRLGMPPAAVEQAFRRMVFNVMAVNHDDHPKNISFHLADDGEWTLAPAYDLTFARASRWTGEHQMTVRGKTGGITRADLLEVAHTFAIKRPEGVLEEIREAVSAWRGFARRVGVPPVSRDAIEEALEERRVEMG
jgi:serine/threonine-protein kinase HipA